MTESVKYPRTPHLPTSPGATSDDKWASEGCMEYLGKPNSEIVATEKMDGGNYTMTRSTAFGRSVDSKSNHWDHAAKALWSEIRWDIPEGWRISGESMYARKSVSYDNLPGVFMVFGIWNEADDLLSWDDTVDWAGLLGLPIVPQLYRGFDLQEASAAWAASGRTTEDSEGFVIRSASLIPAGEFPERVAKWVRPNHVRTADNWRRRDDYAVNGFRQK